MKCEKCLKVVQNMGNMTPLGWSPFGWGPSSEEPLHYYASPTDEIDHLDAEAQPGVPQEVPVTKLCEIKNPVRRPA
jgi:hypothetical protein